MKRRNPVSFCTNIKVVKVWEGKKLSLFLIGLLFLLSAPCNNLPIF